MSVSRPAIWQQPRSAMRPGRRCAASRRRRWPPRSCQGPGVPGHHVIAAGAQLADHAGRDDLPRGRADDPHLGLRQRPSQGMRPVPGGVPRQCLGDHRERLGLREHDRDWRGERGLRPAGQRGRDDRPAGGHGRADSVPAGPEPGMIQHADEHRRDAGHAGGPLRGDEVEHQARVEVGRQDQRPAGDDRAAQTALTCDTPGGPGPTCACR